jgi:Protein of unknown function (DUF2786)
VSALNARLSSVGKNNQQRRAARRRERLRRRTTDPGTHRGFGQETEQGGDGYRFVSDAYGGGSWTGSQIGDEELLRHQANQTLKEQIALAGRIERTAFLAQLVHRWLSSQSEPQQRILDEQLSLRFMALLASLWEGGWQPADLLHAARRLDVRCAALVAALITAQAHRTEAFDRAPRPWLSQLHAAGREAAAARLTTALIATEFLAGVAQVRAGTPLVDAWTTALRLAAHLEKLPSLPRLIDPPSAWGKPRHEPAASDSKRTRVLTKIRALLAKAEATAYAAEAEALTAKAQDLMTRHAIDEALLHAHADRPVDVISLRIHISAPYPSEKVRLLNQVTLANRCRLIWLADFAIATLVGTPIDVDQAELLFTSLLVQATRAMVEAGTSQAGSFDRSATFRRSFLASYAVRIGERLTESADTVASTYGAELVPVMQRQAEAVDQEFERLFPHTYEVGSSYRYSRRGWQAGREAADRASFVAGRLDAS